jgi:hypothetical protein
LIAVTGREYGLEPDEFLNLAVLAVFNYQRVDVQHMGVYYCLPLIGVVWRSQNFILLRIAKFEPRNAVYRMTKFET